MPRFTPVGATVFILLMFAAITAFFAWITANILPTGIWR